MISEIPWGARDDLIEQTWWQETVVHATVAFPDRSQVVSRPCEHVELIQNDPGALTVETQVCFDPLRNLDGRSRIAWRRMRDRNHRDLLRPGRLHSFQRNHYGTRPILAAFNLSLFRFLAPQERVRNYKTGLRFGQTQTLLLIEKRVKMIVRCIHPRVLDRLQHVRR